MPRFQYAGQAPVPDGEGGVVRPGDIRDTEPDWGPWAEIPDDDAEAPEKAPEPPAAPAPATVRVPPATASTQPPAASSEPDTEGN